METQSSPAGARPVGAPARVGVQVVLFNSAAKLTKLVRALEALDVPDGGMVVRFLDNSPEDGCERLLEQLEPALAHTYSASPTNVGFGAGHNRLAEQADGEELIWLLNPDTIPFYTCLERLVEAAGSRPRAALIEAAQFPVEHPKAYDPDGSTNWCSGACLLVRVDAWRALRGFDERLFLYGEDVDLSWRAWLAGWECIYVPTARCVHVTQGQDRGKNLHGEARRIRLAELWLRTRYFGDDAERELAAHLHATLTPADAEWVFGEFAKIRPEHLPRHGHRRIVLTPETGRYASFRW